MNAERPTETPESTQASTPGSTPTSSQASTPESQRKKRLLFVDDEPRILQGIKRMLRTRRREWEVETAEGGREALELMEARPVDVIVTDMRMPHMDGAELLVATQARHPETIRIVLSGYADRDASLRTILVAHQFASKPFSADELITTLDRACSLSDLIKDEEVRQAVGSIELLPEPPQVYRECSRVLQEEESSVSRITAVIEKDPALAAKILQVVNSAFFGLPQKTSNLERAVSYLGTETIHGIVLAMEALRVGESTKGVGPISLAAVTSASVLSAQITRKIRAEDDDQQHQLYTTALLHDIGYLTLLENEPDRVAETVALADAERIPFDEARRILCCPPQSKVGAYLLGAWGLPLPVVEAVLFQHSCDRPADSCPLTGWIHLADRACKQAYQEAQGVDAFSRVTIAAEFRSLAGARWDELLAHARELVSLLTDEAA
ncbi:MAG: HDOD domain-containing protein [Candidatus Eisenbacteria bacterium]|uniref:HDOD domain-containing protein n=1 Tax=Eiseniibacteriota bacterium TaxID=2212470 RepID=A0A956N854_UNCEI|nr:HDOD domain-containing protein [Candidatus Eisenbacteria bacterium]MCB9466248.1 HDOD domain-containing protein [Candidatus Eisenbacteria bacterium]